MVGNRLANAQGDSEARRAFASGVAVSVSDSGHNVSEQASVKPKAIASAQRRADRVVEDASCVFYPSSVERPVHG